MKGATLTRAMGILALLLLGLALWVSQPASVPPMSSAEEIAPILPGWDAASAHPMPALPHSPATPNVVAAQTEHADRDARQRADRYALALAQGRFLGPEGAIALARVAPLATDANAQAELALALSGAVMAAAGENDFLTAETLLSHIDAATASHPALLEAAAVLTARQTYAAADPARTAKLASDLTALNQRVIAPEPGGVAEAFARLPSLAALDPEHRGPARLRSGLVAATLKAWSSAIDAGDELAEQAWSSVASQHLSAEERADLEAAARAARERRQSPQP